ncbi:MAG: glutamate-1-semialdehyde 2,1-aminomutase [Oligoflexales bacterium]|nr:glutamate-1-semialdehyde 2,1-aminomutase [Oligoflexales bacterium]
MNIEKSKAEYVRAKKVLVGGVNSPVRAFKAVGGQPIFIDRASGAYIYDIDGHKYIDYVGSWGPALIGHAHPILVKAVQDVAAKGFSFGAPTVLETELAEKICSIFPSIDKLRFVSSGTEACMSALRLARAYTKRNKIIKFNGCYHGHADPFLVKAGSGVATLGLPNSPGVPQAATQDTLIAEFNDLESVKNIFSAHRDDIAAIIIEPFMGNAGFIKAEHNFLQALRQICDEQKALLIFDEVMTGFRVDFGGVQTLLDITPDITTLGKVIGGGLPMAVYGGTSKIFEMLAPEGPVYQAGTLSGNPLAVTAALKTLELLKDREIYKKLEKSSAYLAKGLAERAAACKISLQVDNCGGMFGFFFSEHSIKNFSEAQKYASAVKFAEFFQAMLGKGVYLAPSAFEACFVSTVHSDTDLEKTLDLASEAFITLTK